MVEAGLEWVSSTTCGVCKICLARVRIAAGMVAENRRFCRLLGNAARMRRMSGKNPMSNIWSASSRTRISMRLSCTAPCSSKSRSRPGHATRMSGFARSACRCGRAETPPKIVAVLSGVNFPKVRISSLIWLASSRVGATMRVRGPGFRVASKWSRMGKAKAAVLPVPVWARPRMSRPLRALGIVCA